MTSRSLSELFYTFVERTSVAESDAKLWKKSSASEPRCWRIPPLIGLSATYQNTSRYKEAGLQWRQLFWSCLAPSAAAKLKYFLLGYLLILEINLLNPTQCFFPKLTLCFDLNDNHELNVFTGHLHFPSNQICLFDTSSITMTHTSRGETNTSRTSKECSFILISSTSFSFNFQTF